MTRAIPAVPGPTKANPMGQTTRSAPEVSRTLCWPNRATSGRQS